jgi:DNA-binding CsgD family transcriptional regulator
MVGIYLLKKKRFIYYNHKLKECLGDHCGNLFKEGWAFWYSLIDKTEADSVKNGITQFLSFPYSLDLLTINYHITDIYDKKILIKHEILLHQIEDHFLAINYLFDVSEKEKIEHCFHVKVESNYPRLSAQRVLTISPREKQVLRLIADGYSSKQIADLLYISDHTAITHRKNLIEKFKVKNTAHLVKRALEFMLV